MVKGQNIIKAKPVYIFFIIAFLVIGFVALVYMHNRQANKYIRINSQVKIDSVMITGNENYGALRGAVFYKKGYFISTSAKLIENNCEFNSWESNGRIVDLNKDPHEYTLDDLGLPYVIYKDVNSDTLHIKKDGCILKFLLR